MDRADSERLMQRVFHEGRDTPNSRDELAAIFNQDFICHGPPGMNHSHDDGPEPIERCIFGGAFDQLVFSVSHVEVEGDNVAGRFHATGRHVAEFQGVAPTGEARTVEGTATFRVADGKLAEGWGTLVWQ